ncbi:MAG: V-type ATP synthase subunit I, partial [Clostridiaceae bacterium]
SLEAEVSKLKYSLDFINKYYPEKTSLFIGKLELTQDEFNNKLNNISCEDSYKKLRQIDKDINEIKLFQNKITNITQSLDPYLNFNAPFELLNENGSMEKNLGTIVTNDIDLTLNELHKQNKDFYIQVINQIKDCFYIMVMYFKEDKEEVISSLKKFNYSEVKFNSLKTPVQYKDELENEYKEYETKFQDKVKEVEELLENRAYLKAQYDYLLNEIEKKKAILLIGKTDKVMYFEGWVPSETTSDFEETITNITKDYYVSYRDPEDEDDIPVAVKNNKFVEPFEIITDSYSLPNYKEVDPNIFVAPFYILFFGIMLGDVGYGGLLTLGCLFLLKFTKIDDSARKFVKMLLYSALSSTFFGAIFGGYFGDALPIKAAWFNPIDEPMNLLILSIIIGVVHIFLGMGIKFYELVREGKVLDAIFDIGFWYFVIIGAILMALLPEIIIGKYMLIIGAIGLVLTAGRAEKNIFMKAIKGVLSLYGITAYLGDILSYSRIFALGLSTGLIGVVFNTLIRLMSGNVVGIIFGAVLFVLGHVFNLAISGLGAYVHSSRLQYLEFFGKFYKGEGRAFKPLKRKSTLVKIIEK